ncbi:hypothetical protein ABZT06_08765 [Streptomyces sp. NPDC005483]|uniref:hypothetical protein n=1 Tax=Streptomyces sp. NPDC005483 TaxID=3154882 RepID=UPI0033A38242
MSDELRNVTLAANEMAREIADLRDQNKRLIDVALPEVRRGYEAQREAKVRWRERAQKAEARIAELENALAATGRSLSSFIFDSDDPGADALGAQWLCQQAMPQADDPFAQPRAFRSSVFTEASKAVEGMEGRPSDGQYSREYLDGYSHALEDAAEHLEKHADQAAEGTETTEAPVPQHFDKVPDPLDGCHWCACGNRWPCKNAGEVTG